MTVLEVVLSTVGRRRTISGDEARLLLDRIASQAGVDLASNTYVQTGSERPPGADDWVNIIQRNICTFVSVSGPDRYLRDGMVRYDEPGSMNPSQHAELSLVPTHLAESADYIRRHADRVLIVRPDPKPEPKMQEPAQVPLECDDGHKWTRPGTEPLPEGDYRCPTCGGWAV